MPKQETTSLIPDDGFRELKTTKQQDHQNPVVHVNKEKPVLSMINKYNIAELSLVDRPVGGTRAGFGAVIPHHEDSHDRRYFATENRDFYGKQDAPGPQETVAGFMAKQRVAGTRVRPMEEQGTKIISNMVGEIYNKEYDPQEQTDVQRSWLYQQDPAIRAVNKGGAKTTQVNFFDNSNSLCLGEGVQYTQKNSAATGAYARKGTDVTKVPNQTITRK